MELVPIRLGRSTLTIEDAKLEQKSTGDVVDLIDPCGSMSMEDLHADHSLVAGRAACCRYRLDGDARHLSETKRYKTPGKTARKKTQTHNKTPAITPHRPCHMAGLFVGHLFVEAPAAGGNLRRRMIARRSSNHSAACCAGKESPAASRGRALSRPNDPHV